MPSDFVLVHREMEYGRSPLASMSRALAGKRKQRTETATGFKRRSGLGSQDVRRMPKSLRSVRVAG